MHKGDLGDITYTTFLEQIMYRVTQTTDTDYLEPKLARSISLPVHVSCGGMVFKFINGIDNTISVI